MLRPLLLSAVLALVAIPATAAELIRKPSPHSVAQTADRLEAAATAAGATVFARVDHSAGAASVEMELPEAQLLIFGNPKLGTPAMQADLNAGLDLPLRVLVMDGGDGTEVVYRTPAALSENFAIPADAEVLQMMTGALDNLTGKAVADD